MSLTVKAVAPLALLDEGNLGHVTLLSNDIPVVDVVLRVSVAPRHESERDLVSKGGVEVVTNLKEILKGRLFENVFVQELSHNVVLNLEGDGFEVFKLLT